MNNSKLESLQRQRARLGKLYIQAVADKESQDILSEMASDMNALDAKIKHYESLV